MRGMLVDDDQAILGLGDDIGAGNLAARDAQREAVPFGCRRGGGFRPRLGRRGQETRPPIPDALITGGRGWRELAVAGRRIGRGRRLEDRHGADRRGRQRFGPPGVERGGIGMLDGAKALRIERAAQARDDHAANQRRVAETHLGLGGVDIDVHLQRRDVEEQGDDRMAIARQHVGIGAAQRADQQPVADRAAIDEQILMIAHAAIVGRQRGHAGKLHPVPLQADDHMIVGKLPVGERGDPLLARLARLHAQHAAAVMLDREGDRRMGHGEATHDVETGSIFRLGRAQEFAPRGHPGEELVDGDARAGRQGGRPFGHQHAIVDGAVPAIGAARPAVDRQARDRRDRWQRLAPETQRRDILDRVVGHLGGGMAFQRQGHVLRIHAAAVIADLDPVEPAARQAHGDARRAGIQRVFDDFLERAGGSFDHFACGNAIDQMFGQTAY